MPAAPTCPLRLPLSAPHFRTSAIARSPPTWSPARCDGSASSTISSSISRSARSSKLDFEVLQILRLGVYQLLHLDRVPAAAAVNDAVAMTRRARKTSAAGLVNAVLRAISRNAHRLPLPLRPPEGDRASLSRSLALASRLAREAVAGAVRIRCEPKRGSSSTTLPPPLTLRVNRLKTDRESLVRALAAHGVSVEPARFAPDGLIVTSGKSAAHAACRHGAICSSGRSIAARGVARRS